MWSRRERIPSEEERMESVRSCFKNSLNNHLPVGMLKVRVIADWVQPLGVDISEIDQQDLEKSLSRYLQQVRESSFEDHVWTYDIAGITYQVSYNPHSGFQLSHHPNVRFAR